MARKMSNPEPETPDVAPALRTVDVAVWIYQNRPDRFTVGDLIRHFKRERGEMHRRIQYLKLWGIVHFIGYAEANRRGPREIEYAMMEWGKKYAKERLEKLKG